MPTPGLEDTTLSPERWKTTATFCFQLIASSQAVKFDLEDLQKTYFEV